MPGMTERLTQRTASTSRWISLLPALLFLAFAAVLGFSAPGTWDLPDTSGTLYLRLFQTLPPGSGPILHVLLTLALLWGGGELVQALLPAKTPQVTRILARSLGSATLIIALTPWFRDLLGPNTMLPAITALVWAQLSLLQSARPGKHTRAAFAGLLTGLAAGLSLFVGVTGVSLGIWLLSDLIRKAENAARRTGFFIAGGVVALIPFLRDLPERISGLSAEGMNLGQAFSPLYALFGIGGLLLILLGLLVGTLQKNRILLTFLLLPAVLLKAAHAGMTDPSALHTGAILFFPGLFFAYGIFRLLKGVESGIHAVNPARAKHVALILLILLLAGVKAWAAWILQQP
jgi:hypothetical protein